MQELISIQLKIGEMQGALIALKAQLDAVPLRAAQELITEAERIDAARYLYWHTDISSTNISKALLGMNPTGSATASDRFLERIGSFTTDVICERCGKPIICRNREALRELRQRSRRTRSRNVFWCDEGGCEVVCELCYEQAWQERIEKRRMKSS